jgi:hypothetical protein
VVSQVVGLIVARYVLALPPMVLMPAEDLVARMGPVIQHYLTGDLAAGVSEPVQSEPVRSEPV